MHQDKFDITLASPLCLHPFKHVFTVLFKNWDDPTNSCQRACDLLVTQRHCALVSDFILAIVTRILTQTDLKSKRQSLDLRLNLSKYRSIDLIKNKPDKPAAKLMFCQASSEISLFLKSFEDERHSRRMLYCVNYSLLQVLLFPTFPKNNFKQRNSLNITFNYVDVYRQLIDVATSTYYSIMSCQSSYFFVYFVIKEVPAHMWHDMAAAYKGTASQL